MCEAEAGMNMGFLKFLLPPWEMCSPRIDGSDRLVAVAGTASFRQLEVFLEGLDRNAVVLILILGTCGQGLADEGGSLVGVSTCVATCVMRPVVSCVELGTVIVGVSSLVHIN